MKEHSSFSLLAILAGFLLIAGCSAGQSEPSSGEGDPLRVVATTSIIGDVVGQIGGDQINLTILMQVGQDPHSYEPTPQEIALLENADVIFINGLDLEESLMPSIDALAGKVAVVEVSDGIEPRKGGHEDSGQEGDHAEGDPHFWLDPQNVIVWANNIDAILSSLDPDHAETYHVNTTRTVGELNKLDAYIRAQVQTIPPGQRKLVTNHEAFGYFADAYGFEIVGTVIPSMNTNTDPSAQDLASVVETIKQENVPAIFVDTSASDQLAQVVSEETGQNVKVLTLYSGSLGEPGSGADTYIGMMETNIATIVDGLRNYP